MIAVRYRAALLSTVVALVTATLALPAPAGAVVAGLSVQITRLPKAFVVGSGADTVTAVVSSRQQGAACQRVRWSMLLRTQSVRLDQVSVQRVEDDQEFALRVRAQGDTVRLTDVRFDPGRLCPGRTVTATYRVAFSGGKGSATFEVDALDAAGRLLQSATATSQGAAEDIANPATPPDQSPPAAQPSPSTGEPSDAGDAAAAGAAQAGDDQGGGDQSTAPGGAPIAAAQ